MPKQADHTMHKAVPTLAELAVIAQKIDGMIYFSTDGEMFINGLPARPNMERYAMAVHELTHLILD